MILNVKNAKKILRKIFQRNNKQKIWMIYTKDVLSSVSNQVHQSTINIRPFSFSRKDESLVLCSNNQIQLTTFKLVRPILLLNRFDLKKLFHYEAVSRQILYIRFCKTALLQRIC